VERNLHLDENDITILRNKRISGYAFLGLTEENLRSYGMVEGPLISLVRFAKKIKLEQDEVDDTDEEVDEDDEADDIGGIIEGVVGINISDKLKLSDKCRDELKEKMNLVSADEVGIPSLTLAFLYRMKFLNEGDIVKYGKAEATLHKNS